MQAIILAAGMGRRLKEYTKENTKCMVPVNGVRLIDRVLDQLSRLELSRLIIVVGYQGKNLMEHIRTNYRGPLRIEFVENPLYAKTNNIYSLSLVSRQLQEEDTLLLESDLIFDFALLQRIVSDPNPNLCLVEKYETWMDGTMVCIDADNKVVDFVSKKAFKYTDIDRYYKTINIYKFSREFSSRSYVPFLEAYCKALGTNEYYEQVLRVITLLDHCDLKALPISGYDWYEIDDAQDLEIAEILFSSPRQRFERIGVHDGGMWRFPKDIDFAHPANTFFPSRTLLDELRSNLDVLLTTEPSSDAVLSLLAAKIMGIPRSCARVLPSAGEVKRALDGQNCEWVDATFGPHDSVDGIALADWLEMHPNGVVVHNFGLETGLPGLRLVLVAFGVELTARLVNYTHATQAVDSVAEYYLQVFGKYDSRYLESLERLRREGQRMCQAWQSAGLNATYDESSPAVMYIHLPISEEAENVAARLLDRSRLFVGAHAAHTLAVAVRSSADNQILVSAMKRVLSEKK